MPCAYAHYRFGQEVLPELPRLEREKIIPFKELFDMGLHGPDILFYHGLLLPDRVSRIGHDLHRQSGLKVFSDAAGVVSAHRDNAMYAAYLYGCLCHFALDSICHGYINDFAAKNGVGHNEIEMEFDRALMVGDGLDPLRHDTAAHIAPTRRNCAVIASFYQGVELRDITRTLKNMGVALRLLTAPDKMKRAAILAAFRASGRYSDLSGLVMSLSPNPACEPSTKRLTELYRLAVPLAIKLISDFECVARGRLEPDKHLELNFVSERV